MGKKGYANGMEVAHKAGAGKVIAAFPDVCLSPPPSPTGPIPVPYPNTSFAKDLQGGSTTVTIGGMPLALKDVSYYQTSPLGDEAATRSFGGSVVTHTISGKTYFQSYSMNVTVEGKNVCRHLDLTTSNHASQPGSTPPTPNLEAMEWAKLEDENNVCACCGGNRHCAGTPVTFDDFYGLNATNPATGAPTKKAAFRRAYVERVKNKSKHGCTCKGKVLPEPPCNVFRMPITKSEKKQIQREHSNNARRYRQAMGMPETAEEAATLLKIPLRPDAEKVVKINHLTPKIAGGCPIGKGNLQVDFDLCDYCQRVDDTFGKWQNEHSPING